jgi:hypothetical protein
VLNYLLDSLVISIYFYYNGVKMVHYFFMGSSLSIILGQTPPPFTIAASDGGAITK